MGYKNFLIPLDGSALAEQAIEYACDLANPDTKIHLVSVVTEDLPKGLAELGMLLGSTVVTNVQPSSDIVAEAAEQRRQYLEGVAKRLREQEFQVEAQVLFGQAARTISASASEGIDLIVMASHGRTGINKFILGSVAEGVLKSAPCPLLIIPARAVQYTY